MGALLLETSLGDTMLQGLLVTVIGVVLVFCILAFLIAIITLLKHFNGIMDRWDAYMLRLRTMKAEIKALKKSAKEDRAIAVNSLSDGLSGAEKEKALLDIKNEYCSKKLANKAVITEIHANFDAVSIIEKERRAAINAAKKETAAAIRAAKANTKRDGGFEAEKLLLNDELNKKIAAINAEYNVKAAAVNKQADNAAITDGNAADDEIAAVIAAAIAYVTTQCGSYDKKAKFRVRSLKEIKNY